MGDDISKDSSLKITDSDLLAILREADSPVLKTKEIEERDDVPIGSRQIENRLKSLKKQGLVGSRIIIANPEARMWWHNGIEVKQAWPSEDDVTSKIGVEAVDVLDDISGSQETLRKRREAVNTVFKYLFDKEERSVASEMRLVGWGTDMDTYQSPEYLWNNCLKKALRESYFFRLYKTEKEWSLSPLGEWLKDKDEQGLWNNWESHKANINSMYYNKFLSSITPSDEIEKLGPYTYEAIYDPNIYGIDFNYHFSIKLEMNGPVWTCEEGTLYFTAIISDEPTRLRDFFAKKEHKESELGFDVTWEDKIENDGEISITRYRDTDINVSALIRKTDPDDLGIDLKRIKEWVEKTRGQVITILQAESDSTGGWDW